MNSLEGQPGQQPERPKIYSRQELVQRLKDIREVATSADPMSESEKRNKAENERLAALKALEKDEISHDVTEGVIEKPQPLTQEISESNESTTIKKKKTQPLTSAAAYALWQAEQERKQDEGNGKGL